MKISLFGTDFIFGKQAPPVITVDQLNPMSFSGQTNTSYLENTIFDGSKFLGGFGNTEIQEVDYWTVRARSRQLFRENLYAKGLINCLVTNEINKGLTPEACPEESILGISEDDLNAWSEVVETRFAIWADNPELCDWKRADNFGAIQRRVRTSSLIEGDMLVVLRPNQRTRLPAISLISGDSVQTPLGFESKVKNGNIIKHGVELDKHGRQVAYWVKQTDGTIKRLSAYGEKTGRKLAWLVYGSEILYDDVRGMPLLGIVLQSLKEVDRYRDSAQRKAVVNSILAMFIKKTEDKPGTLPITGQAIRKDKNTVTDSDGAQRSFDITKHVPGVVLEELQTGEEPVGFHSQGTDINFPVFEDAIICAIAWANRIPPEILKLGFSNNYSASQAAINEFKIYLDLVWNSFGAAVCRPIYIDWLLSEALTQRVNSPMLLESWRNPAKYDIYGAWISVLWYGSIKPSTDMLKQAKGSKMVVDEGWSTNAREARVITGTKFSRNIKRLKYENQMKVEAMRPLAEFRAEFGGEDASGETALENTEEILAKIEEMTS